MERPDINDYIEDLERCQCWGRDEFSEQVGEKNYFCQMWTCQDVNPLIKYIQTLEQKICELEGKMYWPDKTTL